MSIRSLLLSVCAFGIALCLCTTPAHAQNRAFTYQGRLDQSGAPANGSFPMTFKLWDALLGGTQIGPTLTFDGAGANPAPVSVADGLFNVSLDFGSATFGASARWLEATVNGVTLSPRTRITPSPVSLFSSAPWETSGSIISYSSGNVGIGTSTPNSLLDLLSYNASGTAIGLKNPPNDGTAWSIRADGNGVPDNRYSFRIRDDYTGVDRLIIDGWLGNVGIGTATPSGRLEIASPNDALVIRPTTMLGGNVARFVFKDPDNGTPTTNLVFKDTGYPNLSVNSATATPARLGVNTTDPAQALDVRGEIAFGPTGQFSPVASDSGLTRTLYAVVNSSNGTLFSGSGMTVVRNSAGRYTVTFTTPFTNLPAVIVTPISPASPVHCSTNLLSSSSVQVDIFNQSGIATDLHFSIIVMGPR